MKLYMKLLTSLGREALTALWRNNSLIVKCSHCRKMLSVKDFDAHRCDMPINDVKRIPVVYFQDDSYDDKKLMTGWGLDGVLYTFEVTPRKPISIVICPSDEVTRTELFVK
ncbi:hypothetical protein KEJ15_00355 [Candidatus Bathyarchaeota archaeon]|nr:hypothetical protein [Candidatus Bathyarchaeota archaeon]